MSAENTGDTSSSTPSADTSPVEIVLFGATPSAEPSTPKPDVTDVQVKSEKPTETKNSDDNSDTESLAAKPRTNGVQDRIDELTRARRAAEREAEYWKARAGDTSAQTPAPTADVNKPPVRANFDSDEAFEDARIDYRAGQLLAKREAAKAAAEQQEVVTKEATERAQNYQARLDETRQKHIDFDTVLDSATTPVAAHVADLLIDHDRAGDLMYHFAKNPTDLEALNDLSAPKAALKMAEIVFGFAPPPEKPAPVEKPTTKAPAPITPIGQGRSTVTPLSDLPMDEYVKQRKAQGASWAR
ncbi:hypothetical protein UFOVP580_28 [uncultured Caudovirales phage]|uniref:Scaffolding protein n=1 Tax=uncultured Caudovirales phage TaxID=2100421 RepID=A0A6J5PGV6_9CAUD|nr:hypothetical protein UFOVP580_28 [uncultured Caudovirales phage]